MERVLDGTLGWRWPVGGRWVAYPGKRPTAFNLRRFWRERFPCSRFPRVLAFLLAGIAVLVASMAAALLIAGDSPGGTVRGRGWISSPPGAYTADPGLSVRGDFTIDATCREGSTVPQGRITFGLAAPAEFDFESTSCTWMSLSGGKAALTGMGTVDGQCGYGFLMGADDEEGSDGFRLKVWDRLTGAVVYDNQATHRGHQYAQLMAIRGGVIEVRESVSSATGGRSAPAAGR